MSAPREPTVTDWIMLFALTAMWGTAFMFIELALRSFAPAIIVASRVVTAAVALFAVVGEDMGLLAPLAVLAASFSYALNTIVARRVGTHEPITLACGTRPARIAAVSTRDT